MTRDVIVASGYTVNKPESLTLNRGRPSKLKSNPPLYLNVLMAYEVVAATDLFGPWKVSTKAYYYGIYDNQQSEILAYHWHPSTVRVFPHLHLESASNVDARIKGKHLPTGRISLEEVLRFLIEELKVKPLRADWQKVLNATQKKFEDFRAWPR